MAPKYLREAEEWPDIEFCEIMFDNNKKLCKSLGIKVLPCARPSPASTPARPPTSARARSYIEIVAGSDGKVEGFTCGPSKFPRLQASTARRMCGALLSHARPRERRRGCRCTAVAARTSHARTSHTCLKTSEGAAAASLAAMDAYAPLAITGEQRA